MELTFPKSIPLANLPTPIHRLDRLSALLGGPDIYVKRDDLTGVGLSGNKIRKLEFVLSQAKEESAEVIITCGGIQSNHARATAIAATKLGLQAHLVLRGKPVSPPDGNLFLEKLVNAKITYVTAKQYQTRIDEIMREIADDYAAKGKIAFITPEGASDALGAWGYIKATQEITSQLQAANLQVNRVICATGSGGTQAGLIIGKKLFNWNTQIYGVNVCDDKDFFVSKINSILNQAVTRFNLPDSIRDENINMIDGYVGQGYAIAGDIEFETILNIARLEGLFLDPVYTGKAMVGIIDQIKKGEFKKGDNVLFIHTGGIFGLFPQKSKFVISFVSDS